MQMEDAMAVATKARAVGFNHVAIEVGDIDAALAFYGRFFEFHLRSKNDSMAFIDLGDQFLALQKGRTQPADDGRHFGLVVDDKEAARKALADAGIKTCLVRFSTFSTLGATALRLSAIPMFNSRRRRMCCGAWASRTFRAQALRKRIRARGAGGFRRKRFIRPEPAM